MKKLISLLLVLALALACVSMAAADDKVYKVGVVQFAPHVALDAATQGFVDALTAKLGDKVVIDVKNAAGEKSNCTIIANDFVNGGYDLIMANATPALQAAVELTDSIPLLGTSVTSYGVALALDMDDANGTGINVSGTSDCAPLDEQGEMILSLFPEAKIVGMLYNNAEANSPYQVNAVAAVLENAGVTVKHYTFSDTTEIAAVVAKAADECDVLYAPTDNTVADNAAAVWDVLEPTGKHLIAGEEGIMVHCGVATLSISYYDLGVTTGEMAYEILANGADVSTMAIKFAPNVTKKYVASRAAAAGITIPDDYTAIEE